MNIKDKFKEIANKLATHKAAINTFILAFCCISLGYSPNVITDVILASTALIFLYLNLKS
jgi:hypothetical protein